MGDANLKYSAKIRNGLRWTAISAFTAGLVAIWGCILSEKPFHPVKYFDLGTPDTMMVKGVDFKIENVCNSSNTRLKMAYRVSDNRIETDDYNKWIQNPGSLLTRYLRVAFESDVPVKRKNKTVTWLLNGGIDVFEIDLPKKEVRLGLNYYIVRESDNKILIRQYRSLTTKLETMEPEAFARAMTVNAKKLAVKIRNDILKLQADDKKHANSRRSKTAK